MLSFGLIVMLIGMGVVFVGLILLIFSVKALSCITAGIESRKSKA